MRNAQIRQAPLPPPSVTGLSFDLDLAQLLKRQLERVRRREFQPLGRLEKIHVEASGVARIDRANPLVGNRARNASVDWYHSGPMVALSLDGRELLVCSAMIPPPAIPDPAHQPSAVMYDAEGRALHGPIPTVEQKVEHVAAGELLVNGRRWLVVQPIHQILVIGRQGWIHVEPRADALGRHTCLLYDPLQSRGHFLYGTLDVKEFK